MAHPNHYTTRLGAPSEHESLMITSLGVAENHSRCACQRQCRGCLMKKLFEAEEDKPTLEERKARRDQRNRNRNR